MATKRKAVPGHEPLKGFPDPTDPKGLAAPRPRSLNDTHYPHAQGPVCNLRPTPTKASAYDSENPTCPTCAQWLQAARKVTAARHPEAFRRSVVKAQAAASEPKETA